MEGIPISDEMLNKFRTQQNFTDGSPDYEDATEQLNEVANFLLKTADSALGSFAENAGGTEEEIQKVQWSETTRQRVSELSVLVAKRNISEDILRNSPEFFLGSIVVGKLVEVGIVMSKIKKRNDKQSSSKSESEPKAQGDDE